MKDLIGLAYVPVALHLFFFARLVLHLVWSALRLDGTLFMGLVCAAPDFMDTDFLSSMMKLVNHGY